MISNLILLYICFLIILEVFAAILERQVNKLLTYEFTTDEVIEIVDKKYKEGISDINIQTSKDFSYNPLSRTLNVKGEPYTGNSIIKVMHEFAHAIHFNQIDKKFILLSINTKILSLISLIIPALLRFFDANIQMIIKSLIVAIFVNILNVLVYFYIERQANSIIVNLVDFSNYTIKYYIYVSEAIQFFERSFIPFLLIMIFFYLI